MAGRNCLFCAPTQFLSAHMSSGGLRKLQQGRSVQDVQLSALKLTPNLSTPSKCIGIQTCRGWSGSQCNAAEDY